MRIILPRVSLPRARVQVTCSQCDQESPPSGQLVLYSPPQFLQPLQEKKKRVVFSGREWVIEQDWDGTGVAAVVWEPVSVASSVCVLCVPFQMYVE